MKSKDVKYLKYFARQCQEKIKNREIAPEKILVDWDYFTMHEHLQKDAVSRLNELCVH